MATFNSSEPDSAVQISSNGAEQTHIYQGKPNISIVFPWNQKRKLTSFFAGLCFGYLLWRDLALFFLNWSNDSSRLWCIVTHEKEWFLIFFYKFREISLNSDRCFHIWVDVLICVSIIRLSFFYNCESTYLIDLTLFTAYKNCNSFYREFDTHLE